MFESNAKFSKNPLSIKHFLGQHASFMPARIKEAKFGYTIILFIKMRISLNILKQIDWPACIKHDQLHKPQLWP